MLHSIRYLDDIGPQQPLWYNLDLLNFPSSGRDRSRGFGFDVVVEEGDGSREVFECYDKGFQGKLVRVVRTKCAKRRDSQLSLNARVVYASRT